MAGIFRIARAELIKIFKKPSIYIMGILLAVVIAVAMVGFSPQDSYRYSVNLNGDSVGEIYDKFKNQSEPDSESVLNQGFYNSNQLVSFYLNYNTRLSNIKHYSSSFIAEQEELYKLVSENKGANTIKSQFDKTVVELDLLIDSFTNHQGLVGLDFYNLYLNSEVYGKFYNEDVNNLGLLNTIKNASDYADQTANLTSYANGFRNNFLEDLKNITTEPISSMIDYYNDIIINLVESHRNLVLTSGTIIRLDAELILLKNHLQNYSGFLNSLVTAQENNGIYVALITEENLDSVNDYLKSVALEIDNKEGYTPFEEHKNLSDTFRNFNFEGSLNNIKNSFNTVVFDSEKDLESLQELKLFLDTYIFNLRQQVLQKIDEYNIVNENEQSFSYKNDFLNVISQFKVISINTEKYTENILTLKVSQLVGASELNSYIGFESFNRYQVNEETAKIKYQFDNEVFESDYINTFSYNQNSGEQTSFYDFMYYSLKICSIFIIIFAIIMASNIMAYEFDTGTIKLLAIRPFKRWKILFGKLLAVMFFVIIFVLFSAIISFIAGIASFTSFAVSPALVVFNAKTVFVINPALLILIFIVSIILEILFYATISLALSTILKSFAGAMSSSLLVLIIGYVLNAMLVGTFWFAYIPFLNTDMFRFLGGSFSSEDSILSMFINSQLLSGSNFFISLGIYGLTLSLFLMVSYLIFRKRDI